MYTKEERYKNRALWNTTQFKTWTDRVQHCAHKGITIEFVKNIGEEKNKYISGLEIAQYEANWLKVGLLIMNINLEVGLQLTIIFIVD